MKYYILGRNFLSVFLPIFHITDRYFMAYIGSMIWKKGEKGYGSVSAKVSSDL
jgi:hypothetical protein